MSERGAILGRERVEPVYGTNCSEAPFDARPVRSRLDRGGMSLAIAHRTGLANDNFLD